MGVSEDYGICQFNQRDLFFISFSAVDHLCPNRLVPSFFVQLKIFAPQRPVPRWVQVPISSIYGQTRPYRPTFEYDPSHGHP